MFGTYHHHQEQNYLNLSSAETKRVQHQFNSCWGGGKSFFFNPFSSTRKTEKTRCATCFHFTEDIQNSQKKKVCVCVLVYNRKRRVKWKNCKRKTWMNKQIKLTESYLLSEQSGCWFGGRGIDCRKNMDIFKLG